MKAWENVIEKRKLKSEEKNFVNSTRIDLKEKVYSSSIPREVLR